MKLLHCNGDLSIPIENSEVAYNHFIESGATDIYFEDGGNLDHAPCAQIAIIGSKLWIDTMADICVPQSLNLDGISELNNKKLIGTFDLLGRYIKVSKSTNQTVIYLYDDGSFEKRYPFFETEIQN